MPAARTRREEPPEPRPARPRRAAEQPGAYFQQRWQTVAEGLAQAFRWAFILVLAFLNNLGFVAPVQTRPVVNVLIGVWAVISVNVTVVLLLRYRPGRLFALTLTVADLLLGSAIVYFSNGYGSPLFLALFLTVVTSSVRLGLWMGLLSSVVVAFLYLMLGGVSGGEIHALAQLRVQAIGQSTVMIVVGLVTGLMTRELMSQRRHAVRLAAEAETLRDLASELASNLGRDDLLDAVLTRALNLTRAREAAIVLHESGALRRLATERAAGAPESAGPPDYDLARRALADGQPVLDEPGRTLMAPVPTEGAATLLELRSEQPFDPRDLLIARALAVTVGGALGSALRMQQQARQLAELRKRAQALAAQDRSRAELLSLVSHELRRPLAVLNVYGHLLVDRPGQDTGPAARLTETLTATLGEMDAMIEQLAVMARLESGPAPAKAVVDLREHAESAVDSVKPLGGDRHRLTVSLPDTPVDVRCDPQQLRLMLGNLLTNAIKFSPEGGEVSCAVTRTAGRGLVSVTDQGIGIPAEELPNLFKRYSRLPGAAEAGIPGTGLGLYLTRELARTQGGDVKVSSEPGRGSTFTISLPLAQ